MTWINNKLKSTSNSSRIFDINQSTTLDNVTVADQTLSAIKANQKILVCEIFNNSSIVYGSIADPYATAPLITISTLTSGKTYYNQSPKLQFKNLQIKTNLTYSKIEKNLPVTKTISVVNGASIPQLITRIMMRVTQ